ncbi:MAG: NAD-dependent epimerase/dehydratase family protein [Kiritimatiellales bacterium]
MAVLVTGGAGFIGSHVAEHLARQGQDVIVLDDLSGGFMENIPAGVLFVKGSVLDTQLLASLFKNHDIKYIYHLAAYAAEGLSHFIRRFNYHNNLIGSVNLINEAVNHNVKCFVFTSSIAVYGAGQLPMTEEMVPMPEDPYGISKYAVEQDLCAAHEMFGLNYIIFRPHNVYGERQNMADLYRNVLGIFMRQIREGKPLTVFGDGTQTRAFSYIDDVAPDIANAVNIPAAYNKVFNVGASSQYTINELAAIIGKVYGVMPEIQYLDARNEVQDAYSDHSKAACIFGKKQDIALEDGIRRMVQWAGNVTIPEPTKFSNIEIRKNMPPVWLEMINS